MVHRGSESARVLGNLKMPGYTKKDGSVWAYTSKERASCGATTHFEMVERNLN